MRHDVVPIEIPAADGQAGAPREVFNYVRAAVCVHNASAFSVAMKVQGKVSGASDVNDDWFDLPSGAVSTGAALVPIPDGVTHVRVFRTTASSGGTTMRASITGKHARTDA
jgi:hypothetical protein